MRRWLEVSRSGKTSAIATSLVGPLWVDRALLAAPVPLPPQPTRASWMVLFSPAWTCDSVMPARADATAIRPDSFITSRRDRPLFIGWFTEFLRSRQMTEQQGSLSSHRSRRPTRLEGRLAALRRTLVLATVAFGRSQKPRASG